MKACQLSRLNIDMECLGQASNNLRRINNDYPCDSNARTRLSCYAATQPSVSTWSRKSRACRRPEETAPVAYAKIDPSHVPTFRLISLGA